MRRGGLPSLPEIMGHYSYHARLKQRIRNGELIVVREDREPFALRFFFTDGKSMPIRPYRVMEYMDMPEVRKCLIKPLEKQDEMY